MNRWIALALFLFAAFGAAVIGGMATASSVGDWYLTLSKPTWNPPSWVFGPAWTLLYILMSVAAWRIWLKRNDDGAVDTLWLHGAQLLLNALWSILFFGLQRPDLALINILVLLAVLILMQFRLFRSDRTAAYLWLPYLGWVTFAALLNKAIWLLN
ncbi:MAG: tryptophan-rich sensory protein [Opitutaceae bacterium]|nr:tryptophan-rich sensory protein [Opitutaceae bacterium]